MRLRVFHFLELLVVSITFWVLAFLVLFLLRYNGLEEELAIYVDEPLDLPITDFYYFAIMIGLIIGSIYAIIEYLFDTFLSKHFSIATVLLIKSIFYFVLIVFTLSLVSTLAEEAMDIDIPNDRGWWHKDPVFWTVVLYFIIASLIFSVLKIAKEKFGRGIFFKMLLGTYRKPKEEERLLMFLDLKDSTKIAERLGHKNYSRFIQDCFIDLNSLIGRFEGDIYQYVGDEAVISWSPKKGLKNNNCINLFFAFQKRLYDKASTYEKKYNYVPEFKAGIHVGKLIIAEVGTIKKELAFHGDVINTASRIQSMCNTYNASLLVSEAVINSIKQSSFITADSKGEILLKGKENSIRIFEITKALILT